MATSLHFLSFTGLSLPRIAVLYVVFTVMALPCWATDRLCNVCDDNWIGRDREGMCSGYGRNASCNYQLQHKHRKPLLNSATRCLVTAYTDMRGCGSLQPEIISPPRKLLVGLEMFSSENRYGKQPMVNFTFPNPSWKELVFQYESVGANFTPLCHRYSLDDDVELPLQDTLMYDCEIYAATGKKSYNVRVVVRSDSGEGGTYIFKVPEEKHFNGPHATPLKDWHVFFFLHMDHIADSPNMPVTVQSAPFTNVSYNVSLVRCAEPSHDECDPYVVLHSQVYSKENESHWTEFIPHMWNIPAKYAVTVHLVSQQCPEDSGCHVAFSPKFEIKPNVFNNMLWCFSGIIFLLFTTFWIFLCQRQRIKKRLFRELTTRQPTVLLVYQPESRVIMDFIETFAEFLRTTSLVNPLLVDLHVGIQNPKQWTQRHLMEAGHILFLVPKDPNMDEGVTHIKSQWRVALDHRNCPELSVHQGSGRMATLVLPYSGNVPCEISNVRCFKLRNVASLVTWLHKGTRLHQLFLWWPHIMSFKPENASHSWPKVRAAAHRIADMAGEDATNHADPKEDVSFTFLKTTGPSVSQSKGSSSDSDDSMDMNGSDMLGGSVFDPAIPSLDRLHAEDPKSCEVSIHFLSSDESAEEDSNEINAFCT